MWDLAIQRSPWRFPVRKASLVATVLFVASLLCNILLPSIALAADATWSGQNLSYDGKTFVKSADIKAGDKRNPIEGTHVYEYSNTTTKTLEVLYIDKGTDVTKATSAQYVLYNNFTPPDTFSAMSSPLTVKVTGAQSGSSESGKSRCVGSTFEGLGWLLCPLSNLLAKTVDNVYGIISSFLVVTTLTTDQNNSVFKVWQLIVGLANIGFIFAFLYVVYVHITSVNVAKYHLLKKSLPRMLVAAVLVNISYWICAAAVDISNLLGYSIEQMFIGIRQSLDLNANIDWSALTAFILSAGAIGAGTGLVAATGALITLETFGALGNILLATLIPVVFAIFVAFIILAARQALIVVFIIISPLAFVAWTLPNTEKYFQRWLNAFSTLLLMFPIFSMIFGGSILAGAAIINSANGNLMIIMLGMAVQVVPLVLTPLIIRFSTGILGQVANITNNSKRGVADRSRNWAMNNAGYFRDKNLGKDAEKWQLGRKTGQTFARRRIVQDTNRKTYQQNMENRAHGHKSYTEADERSREAERDHKRISSDHTNHWNTRMKTNVGSLEREMAMRNAEQNANLSSEQINLAYENARAGRQTYGMTQETARSIQDASERTALTNMSKSMADYEQRRLESDVLINGALSDGVTTIDGQSIRDYAGGILNEDAQGANKALAYAVATRRSQFGKGIGEAAELIKHFNPSSESLQQLVTGRQEEVVGTDSNGRTHTFKRQDVFAMEAAIEKQMSTGTVNMVDEIIEKSGSDLAEYRTSISEALAKAGHSGRSIYQGGSLINEIAKGTITSRQDLTRYIQEQIAKGKVSPVKLSMLDAEAAKRFYDAASQPSLITNESLSANYADELAKLKHAADVAIKDSQINSNVANNTRPILEQIRDLT